MDRKTVDLFNELNILARNLEALLDTSADITEDKLALIRNNALDALHNAKYLLEQSGQDIIKSSQDAATCVNTYIKNNPWQSVGIATVVGAVLSAVLIRK